MKALWILFAATVLALVLHQEPASAQFPASKISFKNATVIAANPNTVRPTLASVTIENWTAEWHGTPRFGNWVQLKGVVKNVGNAATPAGLVYRAEINEAPLGGPFANIGPANWIALGTWQSDPLKPNQSFVLDRAIERPMRGLVAVRLTVLSAHKIPNSQDFHRYAEKSVILRPLTPDLGVSDLIGKTALDFRGGLAAAFTPTFVAKIKNYGHQQAVVDYTGGRSWKLYLARGSNWEFITEGPISPLKLGQERTIDLRAALLAKYPMPGPGQNSNANLPHTLNRAGTGWKFELTGSDVNYDNDSKKLFFVNP